jgi:hypothetical protein
MPRILMLMLVGCVAGCQAGASFNPPSSSSKAKVDTERTQLAAYAATAQYPRDVQASDDLRAAAMISRDRNSIRVINFSEEALRDAVVWVNGTFVRRVDNIPPNGSVTLNRADFYDATGHSLMNQASSASRIQIQLDGKLYDVQGPVYE